MNDAKLKRWGWGAIIGLVGVILVAGLVIAVSLSSPKPTANEGVTIADSKTDTTKEDKKAADKKAAEEKKAAEKKAADEKAAADKKKQEEAERQAAAASESSSTNMPKTGPLDTTVAVLGGAVVAYLAALNFGMIKKRVA